jgi:hypothetical protein
MISIRKDMAFIDEGRASRTMPSDAIPIPLYHRPSLNDSLWHFLWIGCAIQAPNSQLRPRKVRYALLGYVAPSNRSYR